MPSRGTLWSRQGVLVLQIAVFVAITAAFAAHVTVTWAVVGSIDRVVLAVDAAFALLGLLASSLHLQQLGRERRRQRLVQSLARALASPRDVAETAAVAATLLVETGVAEAVVVGVVRGPADAPAAGGAIRRGPSDETDGAQLAPLARIGFPPGSSQESRARSSDGFGVSTVARELAAGDSWLDPLRESLGARPVVARVPLRRGGELLGALVLVARDSGPLSDRLLLGAAAALVATALDNARLYQATLDQARDLEAQDSRRREFLYAISHELRTPLTSIRAFAELLAEGRANRRGRRAQDPEEEELLGSLTRGVDRLSDLVEDLLQLGRSEEVTTHVELTLVDATLPLRSAESIIRPSFMRRQQALHVQLPSEPVWVLAEVRTLEHVLINLLSNANRHSPEGGSITATLTSDGPVARFAVSDSGPGVASAERTRIFEPFYRVRQSGTQVPGSGLGLAIARRGVEQLRGRIWVEDGDSLDPSGPGAKFCVEIPLVSGGVASEPADAPASATRERERPAPRALQQAVDDATQLHMELQQRE